MCRNAITVQNTEAVANRLVETSLLGINVVASQKAISAEAEWSIDIAWRTSARSYVVVCRSVSLTATSSSDGDSGTTHAVRSKP